MVGGNRLFPRRPEGVKVLLTGVEGVVILLNAGSAIFGLVLFFLLALAFLVGFAFHGVHLAVLDFGFSFGAHNGLSLDGVLVMNFLVFTVHFLVL